MIAGMPRPALESAVRAVDWQQLRSTYESGEIVRDIVLGLASRDEADVNWAWEQITETVLQHQGTVYPATARWPTRRLSRSSWRRLASRSRGSPAPVA